MEIRKYTNFQAFNALGMQDFGLERFEDGTGNTQNLVVLASQGYWEHFGAEIKFIGIGYIACASFFIFATLRQASLEEFPLVSNYPGYNFYCFEGDSPASGKPATRYYIIAKDVEIVVHYAGENIEEAFGLSDNIEQEIEDE